MRAARLIVVVLALAGDIVSAAGELGTFVEFVPQSQCATRRFDCGLVAFVLQQTDPDDIRPTFITHSADELVGHFRQLPSWIREHGIWITLAENDPYSAEEKLVLRTLEVRCRLYDIPMFIRTGMQSDTWQQVSGDRQ